MTDIVDVKRLAAEIASDLEKLPKGRAALTRQAMMMACARDLSWRQGPVKAAETFYRHADNLVAKAGELDIPKWRK